MRRTLPYVMMLLLGAGACGPSQVVVTMEIEVDDPSGDGMMPLALSDIEVQLIPFDRDAVFDSISALHPEPEPPIPPELLAAREEVRLAQEAWDEAQTRWGILRDTLSAISETLEEYNRGEAQYLVLFREYNDFEAEYTTVEQEVDAAFARFDSLQQGTLRASDSIAVLQENWANDAFASVDDAFTARLRATGLDLVVDTTNASGVAVFEVDPGQYWVHSRYELTYTELYWNEPVTVEGGEPVQFRLTRENAEERPVL